MDTWTDTNGGNFMSVTGHWIGNTKAAPQDWTLRQAQLALVEVDGRHTGNNLARLVVQVIDRYGIRSKVHHSFYGSRAICNTTYISIARVHYR
jgi:hypothetical protein